MSLALPGNEGSVMIGANTVAYLNNWKLSIAGAELDTTKFGDTDKRRQTGIKSGSGSGTGTLAGGDTTGQDILWTNYQARTPFDLILMVDDTSAITVSAIITKMTITDEVNGVATFSFDFESDGAIAVDTF